MMNIKNEIAKTEDKLLMVEMELSAASLPKYQWLDLQVLERTLKGKLELLGKMQKLQDMVE